jgi:hypothetical protein
MKIYTGTLIMSEHFHPHPYLNVKCDDPNLPGNRNGVLQIDPVRSRKMHPWFATPGTRVKFEFSEWGYLEHSKYHAKIL